MSVLIPSISTGNQAGLPGVPTNTYNDLAMLAAMTVSTIVSYTVPVGKKFFLDLVEFDGCNIAEYRVKINSVIQAQKATYFGGKLHGDFYWNGLEIAAGIVVLLEVNNFRTDPADFHGRILGRLDDV